MDVRVPHPLWLAVATAVLVVGAVGLCFGVPLCRHHQAVRQIERRATLSVEPGGPRWLRARIGDGRMKFFDQVRSITVQPDFDDSDARHLAELQELKDLWLGGSNITNMGMANLRGLCQLRVLEVSDTQISDDGLKWLARNRTLECMIVERTHVSDAVVPVFTRFSNLKVLSLDEADISDGSVALLKQLKSLERLSLRGTHVTDDGLRHLRELPMLVELDVHRTPTSETAVDELMRALPRLKVIR